MLRSASGRALFAHAGTCVFLACSWFRLFQLRPHLATIFFVLALVRLAIEPREGPSRARIALAALVVAVAANFHPAFMIGPLLLAAALCGLALDALLSRGDRDAVAAIALRARRIGAALALGLALALANPSGVQQHLAMLRPFFDARDTPTVAQIHDEWAPLAPFDVAQALDPSGPGAAAIALATLAILFAAWIAAVSIARRRKGDGAEIAVALASAAAMLVAVRFAWMVVFALALLARTYARSARAERLALPLALVAVSIALLQPFDPAFAARAARVPARAATYVARPFESFKHFPECVHFLRASGVEGRLFNSYGQGGFLGYWLAPRVLGFTNGSLNHPARVLDDALTIESGAFATGDALASILAAHRVDIFFGSGMPKPGGPAERRLYTTTRVERASGWRPVFRAARCSVFVRADGSPASRARLDAIARHFEREGVPFDAERGFDAVAVAQAAPAWAEASAVVPRAFARIRSAASATAAATARTAALDRVATAWLLVGAHDEAASSDEMLLAATSPGSPEARAALRRLVFVELARDRVDAARERALELERTGDALVARAFVRAVDRYAELRATGARPGDARLDAIAASLPALDSAQAAAIAAGYARPAP